MRRTASSTTRCLIIGIWREIYSRKGILKPKKTDGTRISCCCHGDDARAQPLQGVDAEVGRITTSAYAMPEDTRKAIAVDGMVLNKVLNGSNMNSDGTVINHKIMHPDYMSHSC